MEFSYIVMPSIIFATAWVGALLLGEAWMLFWNWIDDSEHLIQQNPVMRAAMKICCQDGDDYTDVWLYVAMIVLWPAFIVGAVIYFAGLHIRELRRRYKLKAGAKVSA